MKSQRKVGEIVITDNMHLWAVAMFPTYKELRAAGFSIEGAAVYAAIEASDKIILTDDELINLKTLIKENKLLDILGHDGLSEFLGL